MAGRFLVMLATPQDRKSTRLNCSHGFISYAVFCLEKETKSEKKVRGECIPSNTGILRARGKAPGIECEGIFLNQRILERFFLTIRATPEAFPLAAPHLRRA